MKKLAIFPRFWALQAAILAIFKVQIGDFSIFWPGNTEQKQNILKNENPIFGRNFWYLFMISVYGVYTSWEWDHHGKKKSHQYFCENWRVLWTLYWCHCKTGAAAAIILIKNADTKMQISFFSYLQCLETLTHLT